MARPDFAVGEIVKARPHLLAPRDPSSIRPFTWPFYYLARVTERFGDDGAWVEFLAWANPGALDQPTTPWRRKQGFSLKELHALDCKCGACDPGEHLRDPRVEIERLRDLFDGFGPRLAEHTERTLHRHRFPGHLQLASAADLQRGDFLLFPQQHIHTVDEAYGDVQLDFCRSAFATAASTRYLVHRPAHPAPVCNPDSRSFNPRYAATADRTETTLLERAALTCLADLGLTDPADEAATPRGVPRRCHMVASSRCPVRGCGQPVVVYTSANCTYPERNALVARSSAGCRLRACAEHEAELTAGLGDAFDWAVITWPTQDRYHRKEGPHMPQPSLSDLSFDLETLGFDAAAILTALCAHIEPEHAFCAARPPDGSP